MPIEWWGPLSRPFNSRGRGPPRPIIWAMGLIAPTLYRPLATTIIAGGAAQPIMGGFAGAYSL